MRNNEDDIGDFEKNRVINFYRTIIMERVNLILKTGHSKVLSEIFA